MKKTLLFLVFLLAQGCASEKKTNDEIMEREEDIQREEEARTGNIYFPDYAPID